MRDHPRRRRLAVGAGHGHDRDARGRPSREQQVDDVLRDVLRLALGRVRVHAEPRRRVHLDDRAAGLPDGLRDVRREEVDPRDVEPDDPSGLLGDLDVLLVRLPRPVDRGAAGGHVAGRDELDERPRRAARRPSRTPALDSATAASSTLMRVRTFS